MRGPRMLMFLPLIWPAVSALFIVEVEQSSYEAKLHEDIELVCRFSKVKNLSDLIIIWRRVEPQPAVEVYRYERGVENHNYTSPAFRERARLLHQQLNNSRAVLHFKKLRMKDSGRYQCVVRDGYDGHDYKHLSLSVTAPNTVKKSVRRTGQTEDEVELSCEFQGHPHPQVIWSDEQNMTLTEKSSSFTSSTDEDLINIISKLRVKRDVVKNYTCSFLMKGDIRHISFIIPDEVPLGSSHQYVWMVAVLMVLLAIIFIFIIIHRRKHGQKDRRNKFDTVTVLLKPQTSANPDSELTVNESRSAEHAEKLLTERSSDTAAFTAHHRHTDEKQTFALI